MIDALIIEDEKPALDYLQTILTDNYPDIRIIGVAPSVTSGVDWFNNNKMPDLVFMDIQLSDGLSFEIFDSVKINCPIIFTTAYEEYAIKAFKVNGVDYLLKPIKLKELDFAVHQYKKMKSSYLEEDRYFKLDSIAKMLSGNFKKRFVVHIGARIKFIQSEDIVAFYSLEKATYIHTVEGSSYPIDYSLDQLEELLDPTKFFRINRKYIVSINQIKDVLVYSQRKLKVNLFKLESDDLTVSRNRISDFKKWLEAE